MKVATALLVFCLMPSARQKRLYMSLCRLIIPENVQQLERFSIRSKQILEDCINKQFDAHQQLYRTITIIYKFRFDHHYTVINMQNIFLCLFVTIYLVIANIFLFKMSVILTRKLKYSKSNTVTLKIDRFLLAFRRHYLDEILANIFFLCGLSEINLYVINPQL